MEDKEILKKVADTLLDDAIEISLKIKPKNRFEQLMQKYGLMPTAKKYHTTGITLRNMIRISKVLLSVNLKPIPDHETLEWSYEVVQDQAFKMADVIAIAIHNKKSERPDCLVDTILDSMDSKALMRYSDLIRDQLNLSDFISSIASVRTMNILTEASPMRPEIIAEPIVVSGESAETSSSIFGTATIL